MRIVVTGREGQVAQSLAALAFEHDVEVVLCGRPELDLADARSIYPALAALKPDAIVSAAAYTAVDKAESERELAFSVNAVGAGAVAAAGKQIGVPVLHLSTDYVFDGSKSGAYVETDRTGPRSVYGASKLEGEKRVTAEISDHAIFRTAWVYSAYGHNFLKTMLRLGETRDTVSVVADQWGCPTSAEDIAAAIIVASKRIVSDSDPRLRGIFHLTGSGEASWADFAEHIFACAGRFGRHPVAVNRITTADYPTPAKRPANSRLSGRKLEEIYGITLPHWQASTEKAVRALLASQGS
ncbi:dTDP-4-dehydrorhamnose reductase [Rhizobium sp. KVB221]|uniref:dTDP-4-dehydrorhamnose reductase n=1 Tax=Rhizobium setariae TaxID=2801340 RepID=A0A936YU50_9HYPH|nr:dTDP-4-dehydrorhamnose reductase [Rhizobium setariae]MBL0372585.1 dTDP-4-dehydrorhamnose reductase [Rhizobium setariae]